MKRMDRREWLKWAAASLASSVVSPAFRDGKKELRGGQGIVKVKLLSAKCRFTVTPDFCIRK